MPIVPVIVGWGNSNWDGIAPLADVPAADFARWTGSLLPTSFFPFEATAPGVRVFMPRLPFAAATDRIGTGTGAATITLTAAAAGTNDQWLYIAGPNGALGQGQHRQISAGAGTVNLTVATNWTTLPGAAVEVQILGGSHTIASIGTVSSIIKSATTAAWTSAAVGKWLIGLSGVNAGVARKVTGFVSATNLTTEEFPSPFAVGDGVRLLDGASAVTGLADLTAANSALQDLTFYYDSATSYSTGLEYPSIKSSPQAAPSVHKATRYVNVLPELSWQMRSKFAQRVHVVSLGASASTISPLYAGASLAQSQFSWAHDITHLDFHPASPNGLYQVLTQSITACCQLIIAAGDTPDVVGFFGIPAENDAADEARAAAFKGNLKLIRDGLRKFVADNSYTQRKAHLIPFGVANLKPSVQTYAAVTNQAMAELAAEDSRTFVVDTADATFEAGPHFDAPYYITLGERFFAGWQAIVEADTYANAQTADLPTLSKLRTQVRRRFERSTQSNDHPNAQIDQFLNDALREISNTLGDSAWYLRRAEPAQLESGLFPATIVLDAHVARILRIESQSYPGRPLLWKGVAYTSNLRTQITLCETTGGGPYIVHFIQTPQDLVNNDDVAVLPGQYMELAVVLTCRRLAECVANQSLAAYYTAAAAELWRFVKRDCLRYERMRQEQMTTADAYSSLRHGTANSPLWEL